MAKRNRGEFANFMYSTEKMQRIVQKLYGNSELNTLIGLKTWYVDWFWNISLNLNGFEI